MQSFHGLASFALEKDNLSTQLLRRIEKQKAFFSSTSKGELLLYVNLPKRGIPTLANYLYIILANKNVAELCDNEKIEEIILNYVTILRLSLSAFYLLSDDALPAYAEVFFHIGAITAAMTGKEANFYNQTAWCEPNMSWEEIKTLRFRNDDSWIRFGLGVYQALWKFWDKDFLIGSYSHRSPLDAAWGIRGMPIFEEMHTAPEKVKELVNWCCDWSIQVEKLFRENTQFVPGFRGTRGTILPEGAIVVNADPIDLISSDTAAVFDLPYTSKLFTKLGGGFYHHHSIGLHQVKCIPSISGLYVQHIFNDYPASTDIVEEMIENEKLAEQITEASMQVPIMLDHIHFRFLQRLLPIVKQGRFILSILCDSVDEAQACIKEVRKADTLS